MSYILTATADNRSRRALSFEAQVEDEKRRADYYRRIVESERGHQDRQLQIPAAAASLFADSSNPSYAGSKNWGAFQDLEKYDDPSNRRKPE